MIAFRQAVTFGLAGCIIAACNAQTPSSDADAASITINRAADSVVARVNDTPIYRTDVQRAAEAQGLIGADTALSMDDPIFRVTIDELIDQRLLSLDAVRTGAAKQPEAQRRLYAARDRILGNYRVELHVAETVNDGTIRALYQAQRDLAGRGEERRARQILLADETLAADIAQRLDDEEDFEALAAEFSIDEATRERGGELGWVSRDMLTGAVRRAVFNTPVGGRSAPIETDAGWYVIEVQDTRTPSSRSFEESRDEIARFMTFEAVEELLTDLRDRGEVDRVYDADMAEPLTKTDSE
ncbi:MAG: peptidylprolyl isomerase [Litorimonas sp.]